MKSKDDPDLLHKSPSSRRAWVEMFRLLDGESIDLVALLAEGVGRNPVRGVVLAVELVALLAEGVGRNCAKNGIPKAPALSPSSRRAWVEMHRMTIWPRGSSVALLAEGVGRNPTTHPPSPPRAVALLAEGVGRNALSAFAIRLSISSPSSRRAWVEILAAPPLQYKAPSPSSRRAWVEIG